MPPQTRLAEPLFNNQIKGAIMAETELELFNNQLVQQLVGPQDGNLKIIEEAW